MARYPRIVEFGHGVNYPEMSLVIEGDQEFFRKLVDTLLAFNPGIDGVYPENFRDVSEIKEIIVDVTLTLKKITDNKYALVIE